MKKALKRTKETYYFDADGELIEGVPEGITGNLSGITGNLTGIRGNLTDITGNIDNCEITPEEREKGIHIDQLIQ
jgi:hypothetical protein